MQIVFYDGSTIECSRVEFAKDTESVIFDDVWVVQITEISGIMEARNESTSIKAVEQTG